MLIDFIEARNKTIFRDQDAGRGGLSRDLNCVMHTVFRSIQYEVQSVARTVLCTLGIETDTLEKDLGQQFDFKLEARGVKLLTILLTSTS